MEYVIVGGVFSFGLALVFGQVLYWMWRVNQIERKRVLPIEVWQEFAASLPEPDRTEMFALIHKGRYPLGAVRAMAFWLKERASRTRPVRQTRSRPLVPAKPGVYVLESEGRYKIGRSINVRARIHSIQTTSPYPVKIVCVFWTEDHETIEHELHQRYATKRLAGEWFHLSTNDVNKLKAQAREYPLTEAARNPASIGSDEA